MARDYRLSPWRLAYGERSNGQDEEGANSSLLASAVTTSSGIWHRRLRPAGSCSRRFFFSDSNCNKYRRVSRLDPRAGAEVVHRGLSARTHVRLLGWRRERELRRRRAGTFSAGAFLRLRLRRVCAPGGGDRGIAGRRLVSSWLRYCDLIIVTHLRRVLVFPQNAEFSAGRAGEPAAARRRGLAR